MTNKLIFWRIERGLSQWELANAAGIPRWTIQLIERGFREASPQERVALATVLVVPEAKLFPSSPEAIALGVRNEG